MYMNNIKSDLFYLWCIKTSLNVPWSLLGNPEISETNSVGFCTSMTVMARMASMRECLIEFASGFISPELLRGNSTKSRLQSGQFHLTIQNLLNIFPSKSSVVISRVISLRGWRERRISMARELSRTTQVGFWVSNWFILSFTYKLSARTIIVI